MYIYMYKNTDLYTYVYTYNCKYVYIYICAYVCMHIDVNMVPYIYGINIYSYKWSRLRRPPPTIRSRRGSTPRTTGSTCKTNRKG